MGKLKSRWNKKSNYKKALILFCILLSILTLTFMIYVYSTMVEYENNEVTNYIKNQFKSGKITNELDIKDFEKNKYETNNASVKSGLKSLCKDSDLQVEKKKGSKDFTYNVYSNGALLASVTLEKTGSHSKMLILTIDEWKVKDIESSFERGIYFYDIVLPSDYKMYINNKEVTDQYKETDYQGLEKLTEYVSVAKTKTYTLDNFISKPEIVIKNADGKKVDYKIKDNKIEIKKEFKKYNTYEEAKKHLDGEIDIMTLARNWSLFLTDDLSGAWHGLNQLTPYLIDGSDMYKMAYNWAHNVDITFVSKHSLKNPTFTNEELKNCTVYNKEAFNCEVSLEKNMLVGGKDKVDKMHDYLYFVKYEGSWKLVDMKSI